MYYVVQENVFKEEGYDKLLDSMDRLGLEYEVVAVRPFVEELEFQTDRKDVFTFGALKLARISEKYGWYPGSLMTPNHNFLVYRNFYQEKLLNFDSKIKQFGEDFGWSESCYFIRPCDDTKVFTGKVFDMIEWLQFRECSLTNGYSSLLDESTLIQVSYPKRLKKEFRMWVVGGKVATASMYKLGSRTLYSEDVDPAAIEFCEKMADVFQLARAFVMDIGLTDIGWKIIECGCINCAGFYKADVQRLLMALEEEFG